MSGHEYKFEGHYLPDNVALTHASVQPRYASVSALADCFRLDDRSRAVLGGELVTQMRPSMINPRALFDD